MLIYVRNINEAMFEHNRLIWPRSFRKLLNMRENSQVDVFGTQHGLTKTEIEILSALLDGHSLRGIAENTKRTYGTTRWHVQNILSKCQVNNQKTLLREFYKLIPA